MANSINGNSGWVTDEGYITSNGNFTCRFDSNSATYKVGYLGHISNAIPVISLTDNSDAIVYELTRDSDGFTVKTYDPSNNNAVPCGFDFIVAALYG